MEENTSLMNKNYFRNLLYFQSYSKNQKLMAFDAFGTDE
jgi:hypothetical protein